MSKETTPQNIAQSWAENNVRSLQKTKQKREVPSLAYQKAVALRNVLRDGLCSNCALLAVHLGEHSIGCRYEHKSPMTLAQELVSGEIIAQCDGYEPLTEMDIVTKKGNVIFHERY